MVQGKEGNKFLSERDRLIIRWKFIRILKEIGPCVWCEGLTFHYSRERKSVVINAGGQGDLLEKVDHPHLTVISLWGMKQDYPLGVNGEVCCRFEWERGVNWYSSTTVKKHVEGISGKVGCLFDICKSRISTISTNVCVFFPPFAWFGNLNAAAE